MTKIFFPNKTALITLVAACFVVNATMGVRQTFGLFSGDFEIDCGISNTEFGHLNNVSSNIQTQLDNKAAKSFAIAQAVALG